MNIELIRWSGHFIKFSPVPGYRLLGIDDTELIKEILARSQYNTGNFRVCFPEALNDDRGKDKILIDQEKYGDEMVYLKTFPYLYWSNPEEIWKLGTHVVYPETSSEELMGYNFYLPYLSTKT